MKTLVANNTIPPPQDETNSISIHPSELLDYIDEKKDDDQYVIMLNSLSHTNNPYRSDTNKEGCVIPKNSIIVNKSDPVYQELKKRKQKKNNGQCNDKIIQSTSDTSQYNDNNNNNNNNHTNQILGHYTSDFNQDIKNHTNDILGYDDSNDMVNQFDDGYNQLQERYILQGRDNNHLNDQDQMLYRESTEFDILNGGNGINSSPINHSFNDRQQYQYRYEEPEYIQYQQEAYYPQDEQENNQGIYLTTEQEQYIPRQQYQTQYIKKPSSPLIQFNSSNTASIGKGNINSKYLNILDEGLEGINTVPIKSTLNNYQPNPYSPPPIPHQYSPNYNNGQRMFDVNNYVYQQDFQPPPILSSILNTNREMNNQENGVNAEALETESLKAYYMNIISNCYNNKIYIYESLSPKQKDPSKHKRAVKKISTNMSVIELKTYAEYLQNEYNRRLFISKHLDAIKTKLSAFFLINNTISSPLELSQESADSILGRVEEIVTDYYGKVYDSTPVAQRRQLLSTPSQFDLWKGIASSIIKHYSKQTLDRFKTNENSFLGFSFDTIGKMFEMLIGVGKTPKKEEKKNKPRSRSRQRERRTIKGET